MSVTLMLLLSVLSVIHGIDARQNIMNNQTLQYFNNFIDVRSAQVLSIDTNYMDSCNIRQAPGFVCIECQILARCVFRNNGWDSIALEDCDEGMGLYCNANEQRCSAGPGPCNPGGGGGGPGGSAFGCTGLGVFPDPFNCQAYHMCFPSGPNLINVNIRCGGNFAFNPITNDCSLNTNNAICRGSQFTCNNVGDMGPWPLNPNIYYICMARTDSIRVLFPSIFRCPVGQIFRAGDCVPPNGVDGNQFECTRAGLFPDPYDCRSYFHCDGLRRSQHITCPYGTYFNRITLGCIRGTC